MLLKNITQPVRWIAPLLAMVIITPQASSAEEAVQGVSLGPGLRLETSIEGRADYTDNKYWTAEDEVEALGLLLLPSLTLSYIQSTGEYQIKYAGEYAEFDTTSRDDYFDHTLSFNGQYRPLTRHALGLILNYNQGHDEFGTSRTGGITAIDDRELDEWDQIEGQVRYTYGAPSAKLNWHIRGLFFDRSYETNRVDPLNPATGTRFLDRSANGVGAGLAFNLSPRTQAIVDISHRELQYDVDSNPSFDGTTQQALFGVRWEATGKTSGEFLLGGFSRDFDDSNREEASGVSWRGRVLWALKSYSTVTFSTGQVTEEHYLQGEDFITVEYFDVDWSHHWTPTIRSNLGVGIEQQDFEGINRTDDYVRWFAGLEVEMAPRYLLSLGYRYLDRESDANTFEFDRSSFLFGLKATF